jgi:MFS family permease
MAVLASALLSVVIFSWQPLVAKTTGLPVSANGLILFAMTAFAALGAWLSRYSSRIPGRSVDVPLALFVVSVAIVIAGWLPGPLTTFVALGIGELLISYCLTVLAVAAHGLFDDDFRNLLWSLFSASMGMAMAIADLLFGFVWGAAGMRWALAVAGTASTIMLTAAFLGLAMTRRARVRSRSSSEESTHPTR